MELPHDSIGITDILNWRECARRASFGMRRHTGKGEQSENIATPETATHGAVWARAYGSAIHTAIKALEDGSGVNEAVQAAWNEWGRFLEPEDPALLRQDLEVYQTRDFPNTRTIAAEDEFRVPLLQRDGRTIYFRFKIDRLYERLDRPGYFIHVDYKSSKWVKSKQEIHSDLQLWAYNFGIYEYWPEVEDLSQFYDQLRYGQEPTRKSDNQRQEIREWLVRSVTAILDDEAWQEDGLLEPQHNDWCAWCPIMESCPVVDNLTDFALARIAALAPAEKQGRKTVLNLDPARFEEYTEELPKVKQALGVLERYDSSVKDTLRQMPTDQREALGYALQGRRNSVFTAQAAEDMFGTLGPRFFEIVKVTKTALESTLADEPELLQKCLDLGVEHFGTPSVVPRRD